METFHVPELHIDKDGKWYSDGVLMTRPEIILLFSTHLTMTGTGSYQIDWQNKTCPVRVDDSPFFVNSLFEKDGRFMLLLSDGRELPMPPGSVVLKNNIPYISLFWPSDTKLSRPAYHELCRHLIEQSGAYLIRLGDHEWPVEQ